MAYYLIYINKDKTIMILFRMLHHSYVKFNCRAQLFKHSGTVSLVESKNVAKTFYDTLVLKIFLASTIQAMNI